MLFNGPPRGKTTIVIRIAISVEAFEAIAKTLPLGRVGYAWLEPNVVDRLSALRGPGESHSDVILRLADE